MKLDGYKISLGGSDFLLDWSKEWADHCVCEFVIRGGATFVLLRHVKGYRIFCFERQSESDTYQYAWMDSYKTLPAGLAGLANIVKTA